MSLAVTSQAIGVVAVADDDLAAPLQEARGADLARHLGPRNRLRRAGPGAGAGRNAALPFSFGTQHGPIAPDLFFVNFQMREWYRQKGSVTAIDRGRHPAERWRFYLRHQR